MKHQIVLVGGQLLPVYVGIKEFTPDEIHFVVTTDTKSKVHILKSMISCKAVHVYECRPFEYASIQNTIQGIVYDIGPSHEITFNLTGGTKIMVLAAQSLMLENKFEGFYINQTDRVLFLPEFKEQPLLTTVSVDEFFALSEHKIKNRRSINAIDKANLKVSREIYQFALNDPRYKLIMAQISKIYKNDRTPVPKTGQLLVKDKLVLVWKSDQLNVKDNGKIIFSFKCPDILTVFFNSAWWENIIGEEVSKSKLPLEQYLQCELPFKTDKGQMKNEIDVLVNLGKRMIFIECKSGRVKQEDINKIKVIQETYGGLISKSILAAFEKPSDPIIEKCQELGIEVYFHNMGALGTIKLNQINKIIENLATRSSI